MSTQRAIRQNQLIFHTVRRHISSFVDLITSKCKFLRQAVRSIELNDMFLIPGGVKNNAFASILRVVVGDRRTGLFETGHSPQKDAAGA